jgi:hypothetical protein
MGGAPFGAADPRDSEGWHVPPRPCRGYWSAAREWSRRPSASASPRTGISAPVGKLFTYRDELAFSMFKAIINGRFSLEGLGYADDDSMKKDLAALA